DPLGRLVQAVAIERVLAARVHHLTLDGRRPLWLLHDCRRAVNRIRIGVEHLLDPTSITSATLEIWLASRRRNFLIWVSSISHRRSIISGTDRAPARLHQRERKGRDGSWTRSSASL